VPSGLQGVRESIRAKLDMVKTDETIETSYVVSFTDSDGKVVVEGPLGKPFEISLDTYFAGVPKRFREVDRYRVARMINLAWQGEGQEDLRVYDVSSSALVWTKGSS
jgi:hypothetical protein